MGAPLHCQKAGGAFDARLLGLADQEDDEERPVHLRAVIPVPFLLTGKGDGTAVQADPNVVGSRPAYREDACARIQVTLSRGNVRVVTPKLGAGGAIDFDSQDRQAPR